MCMSNQLITSIITYINPRKAMNTTANCFAFTGSTACLRLKKTRRAATTLTGFVKIWNVQQKRGLNACRNGKH